MSGLEHEDCAVGDKDAIIFVCLTSLVLHAAWLGSDPHSLYWGVTPWGRKNVCRYWEKDFFFFLQNINSEMNTKSIRQHLHSQGLIWLPWSPLYCFSPLSLSHLATSAAAVSDDVYCLIASVAFRNSDPWAQFQLPMELVERDAEWRERELVLARDGMMSPFRSNFPLMRILMWLSSLRKCHAVSGVMAALDG